MLHSVTGYLARFDDMEHGADANATGEKAGVGDYAESENIGPDEASSDFAQESVEESRDEPASLDVDQMLEIERAAFTEHLNSERMRWTSEEGARLGERFCAVIAECIADLETHLARSLAPLLAEHMRDRIIGEFAANIRAALADKENPPLTLRGPADLLAVVRDKLDLHGVNASVIDDAECDVFAHIDATTIQTRFKDLLQQPQFRKEVQ